MKGFASYCQLFVASLTWTTATESNSYTKIPLISQPDQAGTRYPSMPPTIFPRNAATQSVKSTNGSSFAAKEDTFTNFYKELSLSLAPKKIDKGPEPQKNNEAANNVHKTFALQAYEDTGKLVRRARRPQQPSAIPNNSQAHRNQADIDSSSSTHATRGTASRHQNSRPDSSISTRRTRSSTSDSEQGSSQTHFHDQSSRSRSPSPSLPSPRFWGNPGIYNKQTIFHKMTPGDPFEGGENRHSAQALLNVQGPATVYAQFSGDRYNFVDSNVRQDEACKIYASDANQMRLTILPHGPSAKCSATIKAGAVRATGLYKHSEASSFYASARGPRGIKSLGMDSASWISGKDYTLDVSHLDTPRLPDFNYIPHAPVMITNANSATTVITAHARAPKNRNLVFPLPLDL